MRKGADPSTAMVTTWTGSEKQDLGVGQRRRSRLRKKSIAEVREVVPIHVPQPLPNLPRVLESARGNLKVHAGQDLERGKRVERLGRARHDDRPA